MTKAVIRRGIDEAAALVTPLATLKKRKHVDKEKEKDKCE
jgi:hypothetical protein